MASSSRRRDAPAFLPSGASSRRDAPAFLPSGASSRPRLAWPFTIATDDDAVWLIAGEDVRYTLRVAGGARWIPALLGCCDGSRTIAEILPEVAVEHRDLASELIDQLYGERVLVDASARAAHAALACLPAITVVGSGELAGRARAALAAGTGAPAGQAEDSAASAATAITVLVQDSLDYATALDFNDACLERGQAWMWLSVGAMARGYVSPLFLPDAGPCLACLLYGFERLSPVPEIYGILGSHVRQGGELASVPFSEPGQIILIELTRWKTALALEKPEPAPAPLYDLHVLEADTFEITCHTVLADPECPGCARLR